MSSLLEEAPVLLSALAAILGLLVGSFLNVVIYRLPREGKGVAEGRSHCPRCGHAIAWYENVPVISWICLRGKCSACRGTISWRYPAIEVATAVLFWFLFRYLLERSDPASFPWGQLVVYWTLCAVLLAASVIDLDHQILPDWFTIPMMPIGIVCSGLIPQLHREHSIALWFRPGAYQFEHGLIDGSLGVAAGYLGLLGVRALASLWYRREAMGLGDVKLLGGLGGFVGAGGVPLVLLLASIVGSAMGIANILRVMCFLVSRRLQRKTAVVRHLVRNAWRFGHAFPFGPALCLGGGMILLFRSEVNVFLFQTWPTWVQGR